MLGCSYLPIAAMHAYCVSVSCNVRDLSRTGVGPGSRRRKEGKEGEGGTCTQSLKTMTDSKWVRVIEFL